LYLQRVAKARKRSLAHQIKAKVEKNSADKSELESILRSQSSELARAKTLLSQAEFDLKEARFEINQFAEKEGKLKDERRMVETNSRNAIAELQEKLQEKTKFSEDRSQIALFECEKLSKTLAAVYKAVVGGNSTSTGAPKTTRQLLDKALQDTAQLKAFLKSKSTALLDEDPTVIGRMRGTDVSGMYVRLMCGIDCCDPPILPSSHPPTLPPSNLLTL
jgi:DNA repair exonuclease SbcCD ATPase subunit